MTRKVYMHKTSGGLFLAILYNENDSFCLMEYGDKNEEFSLFFTDSFEYLGEL